MKQCWIQYKEEKNPKILLSTAEARERSGIPDPQHESSCHFSITAEARERAVKAIAFAKLLRKDLEVAAEFSFLADSGAVLERLHFTGHVQVHKC
jgi:hypothetical protein